MIRQVIIIIMFFFFLFEDCKENGAIFIVVPIENCALIEDSTFISCRATVAGGSLTYSCEEGQIVQQRTCYFASKADQYMTFVQSGKNSSFYKDYLFEISVSECSINEAEGHCTISIGYGDIFSQNVLEKI